HFLLPDGADTSGGAVKQLERAEVIVVVDISDLGRLGDLAHAVRTRGVPVVCIDHHVSKGSLPPGPRLLAPEATATAELVFDLASALDWPLSPEAARARYVGILTDTGGFRFANGRVKVSFRSMGGVDVADLAHPFGGGGHQKAAGASFEGSIADVQERVLAAAREYLRAHPD